MNQVSHTDAIPSLAVRRLRGSIRTELEIAGASSEALKAVDKALDDLALEMLVITAAEVLTQQNHILEYAVRRACERMDMDTYVKPEEVVDRICYDTATREAIAEGYARLRKMVNAPQPQPDAPFTTPMVAVPAPKIDPPPPAAGRFPTLATSASYSRHLRPKILLILLVVSIFLLSLVGLWKPHSTAPGVTQPAPVPPVSAAPAAPRSAHR